MGVISIVVSDLLVLQRLTEALSDRFRLVVHEGWGDFQERAAVLRPLAIVIDPYSPSGPPTIRDAVQAAQEGEFGIVACADFQGRSSDLYALGLAGVRSVLLAPHYGSRQAIQQAVDRAIAMSVANAVVSRLSDQAPQLALDAIHWAVGHATDGMTAEDLARGLAATPKALGNQLRKNKLPPARRTLLWGRLFYAAWALSRDTESIEELAIRLGYSTRSGLTKALSEAVGVSPTALAAGDARAPVVQAYLHEIDVA
jgi:AraC-like DNA-binding protein